MKGRSWIVIGIIFFIFMTFNNLWIVADVGEYGMALEELQKLDSYEDAKLILVGIYSMWLIFAVLHGLSVYMIIKGVKKRRIENCITVDTQKNKVEEKRDSSLEILKKRYASGEISEDEFNKMKEDLE